MDETDLLGSNIACCSHGGTTQSEANSSTCSKNHTQDRRTISRARKDSGNSKRNDAAQRRRGDSQTPYTILSHSLFSMALLFYLAPRSQAYSDGAPSSACNTMMPNLSPVDGHGAPPMNGKAPYEIRTYDYLNRETHEYVPGVKRAIRVEIRGDKFRGFMLQARTLLGSGKRVGIFVPPLPIGTKLLDCDAGQNSSHSGGQLTEIGASAVTHANSWIKHRHSYFFWIAPLHSTGPVVFVATIAKSRTEFWTNVQSPALYPKGNANSISRQQCGGAFGCVRVGPPACWSTASGNDDSRCDFVARWQCANRGRTTYFEMVGSRPRRFMRSYYQDVQLTDSFVGLLWRGGALLCRHSQRGLGPGVVTANDYFIPPSQSEIYVDPSSPPLVTKANVTADGDRFVCRFQKADWAGPSDTNVMLVHGTLTQDGWVARMHSFNLSRHAGGSEPFRLCGHADVRIVAVPSAAALQLQSSLFSGMVVLLGWRYF